MDYVCLIYLDAEKMGALTQDQRDGFVNGMLDNDDEMRRTGHYVTSNALQIPMNAASVRVRSGKLSVTDGPFAETKEHLSGYIVIRARDLNEAIQVAARIPLSTVGTIEVRPVDTIARVEPQA